MGFDRLLDSTGSHVSFVPEAFGRGKQVCKFLRNAGFYLTFRKPSTVHVELISGYLDCLVEFGEFEFPLHLTHRYYKINIYSIYFEI